MKNSNLVRCHGIGQYVQSKCHFLVYLQSRKKYFRQTHMKYEIVQYGKTLVSIFQHFSANIKKNWV